MKPLILKMIIIILLAGLFVQCRKSNMYNPPAVVPKTNKDTSKFASIKLSYPFDKNMVTKGKSIFYAKCSNCHKLSGDKLVGPGWKGITQRRTVEAIMDKMTTTDLTVDSDFVQNQSVVVCEVQMPNQTLTYDQARAVLEFMRKNDSRK